MIEKFVVYEERFPERFTGFQDPPVPACCSTEISTKYKMVKINVESFSEEELMKRWSELVRKESWDEECEICKMPVMLHEGPCTRIQGEANAFEFGKLWEACSLFKEKMKPLRKWQPDEVWQADEEEKIKIKSDI